MSPATPKYERIAFVASPNPEAHEARRQLIARYGDVASERADVIVALGGDGLMLQTSCTPSCMTAYRSTACIAARSAS